VCGEKNICGYNDPTSASEAFWSQGKCQMGLNSLKKKKYQSKGRYHYQPSFSMVTGAESDDLICLAAVKELIRKQWDMH